MPVRIDGHVVGGIGPSGLSQKEDIAIAETGVSAIIHFIGGQS
ncbi:heme-binding protein [Niveibacterium sp. 24ML]|nr:heme-binding protein [Niveibacterium sp. 24ML]MCX9158417.1 heme-binding protein [Niveibacterium sp. 24ML]